MLLCSAICAISIHEQIPNRTLILLTKPLYFRLCPKDVAEVLSCTRFAAEMVKVTARILEFPLSVLILT
jgi:hypothetical protein